MAQRRIRLRAIGPDLDRKWEADRLLRIGRSDALEVVLNDPSISRRHAEIEYTEKGWVARDLGSTNGTFLNGVRIGRSDRLLRKQDLLQCGNLVLTVADVTDEPLDFSETPYENVQVQATARQSLEEAAERLAQDVTRSTRPGEQLLNLLRTGQYLDRVDSLDDFLGRSLRDTVTSLRAKRGAVVLIDDSTGKLSLGSVYTTKPELAPERYFSQTLAARCFRTGQSLLCADIQFDAELLQAASVRGTPMSSVICALLRSPRKHLGVLHLDRGPNDDPFNRDDLNLADALAANMSSSIESAQQLQERQRLVFVQTVIAFSQAIEMRDPYTGGHTKRVTDYSLLLAEEMDLSGTDRYLLRVGAPVHDIGKIGINDAILRKRTPLTPEEFEHMKSHTVKGAAILESLPELDSVIPIVRNHHERWDGGGYPDRLARDKIPKLARLLAVADSFDAMTTDRPYRVGLSVDEAYAQIEKGAGGQFDPDCAEAFLRLRPSIEQLLEHHQSQTHTDHNLAKLFDVARLLKSPVCA
jgi:putative nucleotidyltransferase with HDIG domain